MYSSQYSFTFECITTCMIEQILSATRFLEHSLSYLMS